MTHAKMLKTRRAKQRTRKDLALIAKREKKMRNQQPKKAGATGQK